MDGLEIWPSSNSGILRGTAKENPMNSSNEVWGEGALKQKCLLQKMLSRRVRDGDSSTNVKCQSSFAQQVMYIRPRSYDLKHFFRHTGQSDQHVFIKTWLWNSGLALKGYQLLPSASSQSCFSEVTPQKPWAHAAADSTAGVLANENKKLTVSQCWQKPSSSGIE